MIKIIDRHGLSGLMKLFLDLALILGIVIYVSLPITLKWYFNLIYRFSTENYNFLLVFLFITGVFAIAIVFDMRRIFSSINEKNPFTTKNSECLKRVSLYLFALSTAFIVKIFFYNSILTLLITFIFILAGLFVLVVSELFRQAVNYKEENDLTI